MVGKIRRIGQGFRPVLHLTPMLYASYAFALRENNGFLISTSSGYRKLVKRSKNKTRTEDNNREINCDMGQAA